MSKPKIDQSLDVPADLVKKLLTDSEWRMVKQRYLIISLLEDGLTIREVAKRAKVGTDTVVRVSKIARQKDISLYGKRTKTSTPWVFGKSG